MHGDRALYLAAFQQLFHLLMAGLFVRREARSGGVGRQLLDHVKAGRQALRLRVRS